MVSYIRNTSTDTRKLINFLPNNILNLSDCEEESMFSPTLFPKENIHTKEIESWRGFAESLKSREDKKLFLKMLNDCQKYALAINAKGTPFPTEPLIMALLLAQHKMINWLSEQVLKYKE